MTYHILCNSKIMREKTIPEIVLMSGQKMPVLGFGTASLPPIPPVNELSAIIIDAIITGYRHFDTAACYGSEEALGKAVMEAIEKGLIKNRDELFITSKLYCNDAHPHFVLPALKKSLGILGLDYLDLYLIHWPVRIKNEIGFSKFDKELDILPFDIQGTWKAMEECQKLGFTKSIGVSNFTCQKLSKLLENATIVPAVNQVEMSVVWQQRKLLPFCKEKGINVSAWSPLGAYGMFWGNNAVKESQILQDIAASKNKTFAQVALRWIYEQGASIIVRSYNKERMRENLQIFDWELSKEELDQIHKIPQQRGYLGEDFLCSNGPNKTVEELWDGDL